MGASEVSGQTAGLYGIGRGRRGSPGLPTVIGADVAAQQALKQTQRTGKPRFVWKRTFNFARCARKTF